MNDLNLKKIANERRLDALEMIKRAGAGHIGGTMSSMDILVCLYYQVMDTQKILGWEKDRDRFILSKGHCAEALYAVLADIGCFPKSLLGTYSSFGTALAGHPTTKVQGVESATGALGHGLPIGVGIAIGLKSDKIPSKVYVLMGDGEQAEGSVWEAAMAANKYKLNNLTAIIDRNRLQISGCTEDVMPLEQLNEKYQSFGWECRVCDGHSPSSIITALTENRPTDKPLAVIAETIKGYGSEVMSNNADWHHHIPNNEEYEKIKADLQTACGR